MHQYEFICTAPYRRYRKLTNLKIRFLFNYTHGDSTAIALQSSVIVMIDVVSYLSVCLPVCINTGVLCPNGWGGFHLKVGKCLNFNSQNWPRKSHSLDWRLKLVWSGFQLPSRRYILETVQDTAQVTINHECQMCVGFIQKSMTLNDLEWWKRICSYW